MAISWQQRGGRWRPSSSGKRTPRGRWRVAHPPSGPSNLQFVTDGIESAILKAKAAAGDKHVKLGGASAGKEALRAGLVDQILVHVAPYLLGGGVRLFDDLRAGIRLEKISVADGPLATHLRYRVVR